MVIGSGVQQGVLLAAEAMPAKARTTRVTTVNLFILYNFSFWVGASTWSERRLAEKGNKFRAKTCGKGNWKLECRVEAGRQRVKAKAAHLTLRSLLSPEPAPVFQFLITLP